MQCSKFAKFAEFSVDILTRQFKYFRSAVTLFLYVKVEDIMKKKIRFVATGDELTFFLVLVMAGRFVYPINLLGAISND